MLVPMQHLQEIVQSELNGHVTDDQTCSQVLKVQVQVHMTQVQVLGNLKCK